MIKTIRDLYTNELKEQQGTIVPVDKLDLGFGFMGINGATHIAVHELATFGKVKMYFGIHTNSQVISDVIKEVGEVGVFNPLKYNGGEFDFDKFHAELDEKYKEKLEAGTMSEEEYKEELNEALQEAVKKHKEEVEKSNQKVSLKIHNDEYILLPHDVNIGDYQRVTNAISKLGYSIYDEGVFVEIL